MKAIKALVFFMGVLLILGVALLVYGLSSKAGRLAKSSPADEASIILRGPLAPFGTLGLGQPEGSAIASVQADGSRLLVTVTGGGKADRVVVVDMAQQGIIGQVISDQPMTIIQPGEPVSSHPSP